MLVSNNSSSLKVTVYNFLGYDINRDEQILSKRKRRFDFIESADSIVFSTAQVVRVDDCDGDGFYPKKDQK